MDLFSVWITVLGTSRSLTSSKESAMTTDHEVSIRQIDWEEYARCYDFLLHLNPYTSLLDKVARTALSMKPESVLDAACGTGNLAVFLEQHRGSRMPKISCVDVSTAMLSAAKRKYSGLPAKFTQASLNDRLPFPDQSFDCIVSVNTLYAVKSPDQTLSEFFRVLKLGGMIVLSTPRHGNENGLILREHCRSKKPPAYWRDMHSDPQREADLIREAMPDPSLHREALRVAEWNRIINGDASFHFPDEHMMTTLLEKAGLAITIMSLEYAKQNLFTIAVRNH